MRGVGGGGFDRPGVGRRNDVGGTSWRIGCCVCDVLLYRWLLGKIGR